MLLPLKIKQQKRKKIVIVCNLLNYNFLQKNGIITIHLVHKLLYKYINTK